MKAIKRTIFGVCREYVGVEKVVLPLRGFRVDLMAVTELIVREQRLHKVSSPTLQLMIKIDGRPFWGNGYPRKFVSSFIIRKQKGYYFFVLTSKARGRRHRPQGLQCIYTY